jgi:hypothetical protein
MRSFLVGLLLVGIPALGDDGAVSIRLYTQFQQAPPDSVMDSIRDELAKIMLPTGLAFKWSSMAESKSNEPSVKLAVVHFTGYCDVVNLATTNPRSGALGWTHITDGVILPFSDIDCDGIRAFVRTDLLARPKEDHQEVFGRAVGRVLAHELYHIFAHTSRHGSHGVAKPYYSPQELLSRSFQFEQKECDELRTYSSDLVVGGF